MKYVKPEYSYEEIEVEDIITTSAEPLNYSVQTEELEGGGEAANAVADVGNLL